jgi:hypothetical protein
MRKWGIKLEYWRVKTSEGYGVLHVLLSSPYIPQPWLKRNWQEIHGAEIVDIRMIKGKKRLTRYLIGQYLSKQEDNYRDGKWCPPIYSRQSWSWGWCFRGFVGVWKRILGYAESLAQALRLWDSCLRARDPAEWWGGLGPIRLRDILSMAPLAVAGGSSG